MWFQNAARFYFNQTTSDCDGFGGLKQTRICLFRIADVRQMTYDFDCGHQMDLLIGWPLHAEQEWLWHLANVARYMRAWCPGVTYCNMCT